MWDIQDDYEYISYTLSAKYIGGAGYMVSPPRTHTESRLRKNRKLFPRTVVKVNLFV